MLRLVSPWFIGSILNRDSRIYLSNNYNLKWFLYVVIFVDENPFIYFKKYI